MHDIVTQRLNQFLVEKNITYKELSGMYNRQNEMRAV